MSKGRVNDRSEINDALIINLDIFNKEPISDNIIEIVSGNRVVKHSENDINEKLDTDVDILTELSLELGKSEVGGWKEINGLESEEEVREGDELGVVELEYTFLEELYQMVLDVDIVLVHLPVCVAVLFTTRVIEMFPSTARTVLVVHTLVVMNAEQTCQDQFIILVLHLTVE